MKWVFDRQPASGVQTGGGVADHLFPRSIDSFVRETTQNSNDQRRSKSAPVLARFSLHSLTDRFAAEFLDCIGWSELSQHLHGAVATKSLSRRRIERALSSADDLVAGFAVLVLSDHNSFGLFGDERSSEPNFSNLVRHVLMTSDADAARGGSYGLGKSVLWAFSDISTVLFHSLPTLKPDGTGHSVPDPLGGRFIGRSSLVSHKVGDLEYDPNGLFGELSVDDQNREWSRSVRGAIADQVLPNWILKPRSGPEDTGTSVVIPFFGAPGRSGPDASAEETCLAILQALNTWYWPAIQSGNLVAEVSHFDNDIMVSATRADGTTGVKLFVDAWSASQEKLVEIAKDDGQVAERAVAVEAPKTAPQVAENLQHGRVAAPGRLRVSRTDESAASRSGTVALIRGAGMVVKYLKPPALGVDVPPFVGVFEAGLRHPEPSPEHVHVERFLKAAEPYGHDDWIPNTDRVAQDYQPGAGVMLSRLKEGISSAIREALKPEAGDDEDGPPDLSKKFNLPGDIQPSGRLTIKNVSYDSVSQTWSLEVTMTLAQLRKSKPWRFVGSIEVKNQFGKNESLMLTSVKVVAPDLAKCGAAPSATFECDVPGDSRQATLAIVVDAKNSSVPALMRERVALAALAQVEQGGL